MKNHPKFMAKYQISDVEDGFLYSDKLCIKILDLTQLEKAKSQSETDKKTSEVGGYIQGRDSGRTGAASKWRGGI